MAAAPCGAALTVTIIVPDTDPCVILAGYPYEFRGAAYLDGVPLDPGLVQWGWSFGDNSPPGSGNPAEHTYAQTGTFVVTMVATYSAQQAQDTTTCQVQAGSGTPGWVFPQPGDEVGSFVALEVRTALPPWMTTGVTFQCQEQAQGGHETGPWQTPWYNGGVQPHLLPNGNWGASWQPLNNSWGHNGCWKLRGTVTYMGMGMPPPVYVKKLPEIRVYLLNTVIHAWSDAAPPGLPEDADVLAIDPDASGSPYEHPVIHWEIQRHNAATFIRVFTITIRDMVAGATVKTVNKDQIQDWGVEGEWEWDGSIDGSPGAEARGLYSFQIAAGDTPDLGQTASKFMTIGGVSAPPGPYDPGRGKLPVTLHYDLADQRGVPASEAEAVVYNASLDNPADTKYYKVGESVSLPVTLEPNAVTLDLDPLDGSPYYIVVYARDDHGDETGQPLPVGDREHQDQAALARAVRLSYRVTEVYPNQDGQVYISDSLHRYLDVPGITVPRLYGGEQPCQTADHEASVQALTLLSAEDADPNNSETTMDQPTGGVTVHFSPEDPDGRTLWDPAAGGDDNADGPGTLDPTSVVAERGGDPAVAMAQTTLTFTDRYSGDNYRAIASPYDQAVTDFVPEKSGILEAWKLIYHERDSMFAVGDFLAQDAAAGATVLHVLYPGRFLPEGTEVMVFDGDHHDPTDQDLIHTVVEAEGGGGPFTVTVNPALRHSYSTAKAAAIGNRTHAPRYCEAVDPALLPEGFGEAKGFVAFTTYPDEEPGVCPYIRRFDDPEDWWYVNWFFDHDDLANTVHFVDGEESIEFEMGWTDGSRRQSIVFEHHADTDAKRQEALVHEAGHLFGMGHVGDPPPFAHDDHRNHEDTDGCVMVYGPGRTHPNDFANGIALFGDITQPPTQPEDLKNDVSGHQDPLPGGGG